MLFSLKSSFVPIGFALLASALFPISVRAQAIAPTEGNPEFTVPAPVAASAAPTGQATTDLQFEGVEVTELLKIIGKTFDIDIAIGGDVTGSIAFINLKGKTPAEAIAYIAEISGLQQRRKADGTYIIARNLNLPVAPTQKEVVEGDISPLKTSQLTPPINANGIPDASFGGVDILPDADGGALGGFERAAQRPSTVLPDLVSTRRTQKNKSATPIRVRNVKASVMAYWLDPANNPVPVDFLLSNDAQEGYGRQPFARSALGSSEQKSAFGNNFGNNSGGAGQNFSSPYTNPYVQRSSSSRIVAPDSSGVEWRTNMQFNNNTGNNNNNNNQGGVGGTGGGTFELPGDIQRILAVDPQNVILVAGGSEEDIRQLQEIINVLDRPLRQVEIEAQFVNVTTSDSRLFGIDFSTTQGNFNASNQGFAPGLAAGTFSVGFVRGNFQAQLRALLSNERAKVLTAPRVTAINNLTASIQSRTSQPVILNTISQNIGGQQAQQQNLIFITTSIGLNVTPTINGDDTITVVMQPTLESQSPTALGVPVVSSNTVQTIANVRDGDTIALGGLKTKNISRGGSKIPLLGDIPFIGPLFQSRSATDSEGELIIFVTARIVRRAGDDDVVPGT